MHKRFSRKYVTAKLVEWMLRVFVTPPPELHSIPGYLDPFEGRFLYWLAGRIPCGGLAVEIGSFKGKSSSFLAAGLSSCARLACVDTWRNEAMPYDAPSDSLAEFLENTNLYHNSIIITRSRHIGERLSKSPTAGAIPLTCSSSMAIIPTTVAVPT